VKRAAQIATVVIVGGVCGACLFPDLSGLDTSGSDAQSDVALDVSVVDASDAAEAAAPKCDPSKPFTTIKPIAELNDGDDQYKATLTPDELDIWYGYTQRLDGSNVVHVMHAKRASIADPWGTPAIEANIAPGDVDPAVTDDGLGLYFCKFGTVGSWDLFQATRLARSDPFGTGAQLPLVMQSSGPDTAPFVAFDQSLYFVSERSGASRIWLSQFADGGLAAPALVTSLSSTGSDKDSGAVLTHDGLTAYVSSTRTDATSFGSYDIFVTHRASATDGFGAFTNETELNTTGTERPNWISWDNCRMYFESASSMTAQSDLFVASRVP
jgi:hypothetical protein